MDFERFSQTGGNLPQITAKHEVGKDIKSRGADQPRKVLRNLRNENAAAKKEAVRKADRDKKRQAWSDKGRSLTWTPDLERLAVKFGAEFCKGEGWSLVKSGFSCDEMALLAIMADTTLNDEQRKKTMKVLDW